MSKPSRVDSAAYYDTLPGIAHECGDIWRNLPTFGMLGSGSCCGVIITPACDLSWQKSDTLTYLPIISVRSYFSTDAALPAIIEKMLSVLQGVPSDISVTWTPNMYTAPSEDEIAALEANLTALKSNGQLSAKIKSSIERALSGLIILKSIKSPDIYAVDSLVLSNFFGSEWAKIKDRMIKNSYSPALHFLPNDRQDLIFSAVPAHSLVLFRYPITLPVRVLNHAQDSTETAWKSKLERLGIAAYLQSAFGNERPIKLASLKPAFLSDLLTRFSALYNRIGSPDFSDQTVSAYSSELDA